MPPPTLPPHLSHKSALVLLPPASITAPIDTIRAKHDRQVRRWPAHINLVYPFVANPSSADVGTVENASQPPSTSQEQRPRSLTPALQVRLRRALAPVRPFTLILPRRPRFFLHGSRSATVWLDPLCAPAVTVQPSESVRDVAPRTGDQAENKQLTSTETQTPISTPLESLQAALQAEFSECDADGRPFVAHLSVGQVSGSRSGAVEALVGEVESVVGQFLDAGGARSGGEGEHGNDAPKHAKATSDSSKEFDQAQGLRWLVDRVYVIERKGFKDRFRIVGEMKFGGP